MNNFNVMISHFGVFFLMMTVAFAQESAPLPDGEADPPPDPSIETTPMPVVQENTVAYCQDNIDNDNDTHVDCDDQDCEIFAVCVRAASEKELVQAGTEAPVAAGEAETHPEPFPEHGYQCRDGLDNNGDGSIDCHEESCHGYSYCRRVMYTVPEPPDKAPGYFLNFGIGAAFPNFRGPGAKTSEGVEAAYGESVPFDPDMGLMLSMKTGWLFLKWLGLAVNFNFGATGAGNNENYLLDRDDPAEYKYQGGQAFGHIGGALRFQWPIRRFVPYVDVAGGFSFMEYQWHIYDGDNSWNDIYDDIAYDDDAHITGSTYVNVEKYRHFTLALEPGFDFFVSARRFAIGAKAWLPIVASHHASTDNIGFMFSLTYTPTWRERPVLNPEYQSSKAN